MAAGNGKLNAPYESVGAGFTLSTDSWGRLVLTDPAGVPHVGVEVVRAFPISDPNHGVSIVSAEGHELVWIDDLESLPEQLRERVREGLARREFVPVIRRILKVSHAVEPAEWNVETDRGPTKILLKSDEDILRLGVHRAMVTDVNGVRYLIPDMRTLEPATARILEKYL